jgi:hypothetical protein
MKRTRIVGLCLIAVFALCAMAGVGIGGAQAATYYHCAAQKKGNYTESGCKKEGEKKGKPVEHKGSYELVPFSTCVAQKKGNYTESACIKEGEKKGKPVEHKGTYEKVAPITFSAVTGSATLATPDFGPNNVVCSSSTTTGEITGPKTVVENAVFSGCEVEGLSCESAGPNSVPSKVKGQIDVATLDGKLLETGQKGGGYKAETPVAGEAWDELTTVLPNVYSSEFNCQGAVYIRTTQNPSVGSSLSGLTTPVNTAPSTTGTVTFDASKAEQALLTQTISGGEWVPPSGASSTETTTATVTFSQPIEVKA